MPLTKFSDKGCGGGVLVCAAVLRVNYLDLLLDEWDLNKHPPKFKACLRRVLSELSPESHLFLRRHPKLQVAILPEARDRVWAYFPVHEERVILREQRPATRVLLVISEKLAGRDVRHLRDHLGHVLLYLRQYSSKRTQLAQGS